MDASAINEDNFVKYSPINENRFVKYGCQC